MTLQVFDSTANLSKALNRDIIDIAAKAVAERGIFTLVLSGGSLSKQLTESLSIQNTENWHIFFADERLVPLDHIDSNYLGFKDSFFEKVAIPLERIHTINTSLISDPQACANDYSNQIEKVLGSGVPQFDVILLGMGPGFIEFN